MTIISTLLRDSADRALPVLRAVRDDQLAGPTPCADYSVGDVVNHLFQVVVNFQALARREPADFSSTPDVLGTDWRGRYVAELDALVTAWTPDAALEGVSPGMGLPQTTVGGMVLLDLVIHPWDIATATGTPYAPDPAAVARVHAVLDELGPMPRKMGVFGPEVPVPADADEFTRLLGRGGRDPRWSPAAAVR
ncbi:TIGR03086 family metal-binding protein [Mangrovihabitans endophyticus]|uniref:TIGR03086 family protein n=1 Tax=Mangrovihabitans endophyticus TaxID=1751298 RepID=A0A8J3C4P5_9ACTN|nr:TIGR03086 family metal-binding protein [Mangrovihabitans endophyticus]GGL08082.1 TIGR03086 family protein [Mangrovihabitans endophyticus]